MRGGASPPPAICCGGHLSWAEGRAARAWPSLRALILTAVLLAQIADAIPLPELHEKDLRHPVAKAELKRWTRTLNGWGLPITEAELAARGLAVGNVATRARQAVLRPWRPFRTLTGTGQSWGLFAFPESHVGRLVIRARAADGDWEELFRAPEDGDGGLLSQRLHFRRVRGIYDDACDRPRPGPLWRRFSRWVAREVFEERPELDEVEVRIDLEHVVPPGRGEPDPPRVYHARLELRQERDAMPTLDDPPEGAP